MDCVHDLCPAGHLHVPAGIHRFPRQRTGHDGIPFSPVGVKSVTGLVTVRCEGPASVMGRRTVVPPVAGWSRMRVSMSIACCRLGLGAPLCSSQVPRPQCLARSGSPEIIHWECPPTQEIPQTDISNPHMCTGDRGSQASPRHRSCTEGPVWRPKCRSSPGIRGCRWGWCRPTLGEVMGSEQRARISGMELQTRIGTDRVGTGAPGDDPHSCLCAPAFPRHP